MYNLQSRVAGKFEHELAAAITERPFDTCPRAKAEKKRASKIKSLKPVYDLCVSSWIGHINLT